MRLESLTRRGIVSIILLGVFAFFLGMMVVWVANNMEKYKNPEEIGTIETSATGSQNLAREIVGSLKQSESHSITLEGAKFWSEDLELQDLGIDISSAFLPFMEIEDIQVLQACNESTGVLTLIGANQPEGPEILAGQKYYYVSARASNDWACVKICTEQECSFE